MRKLLAAALILLPFTSAHAEVDLSGLTYAGTGCAAGGRGIFTKFNARGDRLIVYRPDMAVDLRSGLSRVVCSLALPVNVAADERVVIGRPAVFGKQNLSTGDSLHASGEVFFTGGGSGPVAEVDVDGEGGGVGGGGAAGGGGESRRAVKLHPFYSREEASIALPCGASGIVRTKSALLAGTKSTDPVGRALVSGIAFDLRTEKCTAE
jgi:hypothetical protein